MNGRVEKRAEVPDELGGERLDQAAARLFADYSRSRLQAWIRGGELRVDGEVRRPRDKVAAGAVLTIDAQLEAEVGWEPQPIALDIVYEDDAILVLDKPAGLVVHPAAGNPDGTLHELETLQQPVSLGKDTFGNGSIDLDTTEALVVALVPFVNNLY